MKELLKKINSDLENDCFNYRLKGILHTLKEELEIEIYTLENDEQNKIKAIELSKKTKKVHLGSGKNLLNDYINIDINEQADIFWDIRNCLPFNSNTIDQIFSEHVLEHMDYPISTNKLIEESYRVLRKNGKIIIGVPDCKFPLNDIFENKSENMIVAKEKWYNNRQDILSNMDTSIDYLNYVMRDQLFDEKYHAHFWGFDKNNLTIMLEKHGFSNIKTWIPDKNMINPKREWGTLYLIATK